MDLLLAVGVCGVGKISLWYLKRKKPRRKRKKEPLLAQLFGISYYWFKENRFTRE